MKKKKLCYRSFRSLLSYPPKQTSGHLFIGLTTIFLASLACSLPSTPTAPPPGTTPVEVTKGIPSDTPEPTKLPNTATETPTDIPTPIQPEALFPIYLPKGFVTDPGIGDVLYIHNLNGDLIAEAPAPGMALTGSPTSIHVAGRSMNESSPPIVYISKDHEGSLQTYEDGEVITVAINSNISYLIGVLGSPIMTYSTAEFIENALISELYIGDIENLFEAEPVTVRSDSAAWTFRPMAITMESDHPSGIWYSLTPWGIGGDIVFEPRQGLYYLDLLTNRLDEHIDPSINPISFSPDLTWLAFTEEQMEQPMTIMPEFDTGRAITFPLAPESDRGAGNAVFSPDNQYVAWMEGSGMRLAAAPDFNLLIRIASTTGEIITELLTDSLIDGVGIQDIQWVEPVGWLDEETLLLQVDYDTWAQTAIVRIKYDGSEIAPLAAGNFAAVVYP